MVNILMLIVITAVVVIIGGGFGYLVWLKTRPKKQIWKAFVYQVGEGVRQPIIGDNEKVISDLKLQDLKPYAKDILERIERPNGLVIFRLKKLNKTTPAVDGDVVDYWGKDNKQVSVLMTKSGCTLLRKGYDKVTGEKIFQPLSHSKLNLLKTEMAIRKDRLVKEKDILQAITPWIVAGITILGLIAIAYIMISGFVEMSANLDDAVHLWENKSSGIIAQQDLKESLRQGIVPEKHNLGAGDTS